MTHATKAIYRWLLSDFIKVSNIATESMLFTEQDLEISMDKIETLNFHEEKEVGGIKFWAYNAGHVLGAAMFMIEIAGMKKKRKKYVNSATFFWSTVPIKKPVPLKRVPFKASSLES